MNIRAMIPALALAASLMIAGTATADLSFAPNPTTFTNGMITGEIELVSCETGVPMGGTVLEGSVGANDQVLVFKLTMITGSIRRWGVGAWQGEVGTGTPVFSNGAGTFGGDPNVDVSMFAVSNATERIFEFADGALGMGQMSDRFFVAYDPDSLAEGDEMSFMITPGTGLGSTFSIAVPLVPGPGSLAVLVGAFALLSARGRKRD